jgi:hypothetical protein
VDPQAQYAAGIFIDQLKRVVTSSDAVSELSRVISAMEEYYDEANVNQQIANARNVSVDSVVNEKKKLRRFGNALRTVQKHEPPE